MAKYRIERGVNTHQDMFDGGTGFCNHRIKLEARSLLKNIQSTGLVELLTNLNSGCNCK